jgi:hypothetical protein
VRPKTRKGGRKKKAVARARALYEDDMRRGELGNATGPEVWLLGCMVFKKVTPPWWKFWKKPEVVWADSDYLQDVWHLKRLGARVVLLITAGTPYLDDGVFFRVRVIGSQVDAHNEFRRRRDVDFFANVETPFLACGLLSDVTEQVRLAVANHKGLIGGYGRRYADYDRRSAGSRSRDGY